MPVDWFARHLLQASEHHRSRFAVFLGAGCSVSSGIPSAGDLVRHLWLPNLRDLGTPQPEDLDRWAKERFPRYDPDHPAAAYGEVLDALFPSAGQRQREIENLCSGKSPGFGYAVLANLMARPGGFFNVALTTNFDDLVADALYLYTRARPLVVHHESLARFIRRSIARPLVVKLHGDNRLEPLNTAQETSLLDEETKHAVRDLLRDCGLVFVGYGGNDEGIREMLEALPRDAPPLGVYWVGGREPTGTLRPWLDSRGAVWVEQHDFDELMLLIKDAFGLPHADIWQLEAIATRYANTYKALAHRVRSLPDAAPGAPALKTAVKHTDETLPGWWAVEVHASQFKQSDPDLAEDIYARGVKLFPASVPLLGNVANFLMNTRQDDDRAEELYRRAIDLDPNYAIVLGDYAVFLRRIRGDHDAAERFFRRAFAADPHYGLNLSNYANFLLRIRNDRDGAGTLLERAIRASPYDANVLGSYASFLSDVRGELDRAEEAFLRAIELDPTHVHNLGMYATLLYDVRKDYDRAEAYFDRALAIHADDPDVLGNHANFLAEARKNYDRAAELYRRALEVDPNNAVNLGNYANYLRNGRRDYRGAATFYRRALDANPANVVNLGNYATLRAELEEFDRAEELYRCAIDVDPNDAHILGNYAVFLAARRKDYGRAEEYFRRARAADPADPNALANLAGLLLALGQRDEGLTLLDALLRLTASLESTTIAAEGWFYAVAHRPAGQRGEALRYLKRVLTAGARSPGWDLGPNIRRAEQDGHPDVPWLERLAAVISDGADIATLTAWEDWNVGAG